MIDKERVHELAKELRRCQFNFYEEIITEWLEQNQPEPIVTGLTDEQIKDLACVVSSVDYDDFHTTRYDVLIQNWFKKQTFTQEVQAVAVGLSDEQVNSLFEYFPYKATKEDFIEGYNTWAKTQTFTQPEQFAPNWNDAPELAEHYQVQGIFYNKALAKLTSIELYAEQRPKPTPVIEVGQVWKYQDSKYQIDSIGKVDCAEGWVDCVTYRGLATGLFYTRKLDVFLEKFERVG